LSSEKTTNLQLNKWVPTDYVRMDEFNENFDKIDTKIGEHTTQLSDITINLDISYPRLLTETTDLARLQRAIAGAPLNSTILLPDSAIDLNGTDLIINRTINIKGKQKPIYDVSTNTFISGTRLVNGGIIVQADCVTIENVGVYCPSMDNGFQINTSAVRDIEIRRCIAVARDHGYLAESYYGTVKGTKVIDCQSYGSVHGFISKAEDTVFERCLAYGHSGWGFGAISDNIKGAGNNALSKNNKIIDCKAVNCSTALAMYSRNYQGTDHDVDIIHEGAQVVNFSAENCNNLFYLGDPSDDISYKTFPVGGVLATNLTQTGTGSSSILANYSQDCVINNLKSPYATNQKRGRNKNIKFSNDITSKNYYHDIRTLAAGSTPELEDGAYIYLTNNNGTITNLKPVSDHDIITIIFQDDNTIIKPSSNINLFLFTQYSGKGSFVVLKYQDGVWFDIQGHSAAKGSTQRNLISDGSAIDISRSCVIDVYGSGSTTNIIDFKGKNINSETITLIIRSSGGVFSYGGFNTANFSIPSGFPTSLNFGTASVSQWVFMNATNKWVCVSLSTAPYT
jgi:hypothetical protein